MSTRESPLLGGEPGSSASISLTPVSPPPGSLTPVGPPPGTSAPVGPPPATGEAIATGRFALFADCLLVGLFVVLASLPLVTAYVALVAGCAVLRDLLHEGRSVGPLGYWRRLRQVVHTGVSGLLVPPVVVAVLALDGLAVAAGVPGRPALAVVLVAACGLAVVGGLRAAARWRPGERWPAVTRAATADLAGDPGGSVLLLLAAGCAAGIASAVPVTVLLLPGLLALAAVAVGSRRPHHS